MANHDRHEGHAQPATKHVEHQIIDVKDAAPPAGLIEAHKYSSCTTELIVLIIAGRYNRY